MNTKQPRSEGVRRIVIVCSVVLPVLWVMWAIGAIGEIIGDLSDKEIAFCILIGVMGSIGFFLIPRAIAKNEYWIIDGFREDEDR